jgi:hypothetical protein
MKYFRNMFMLTCLSLMAACADYLDVIPDNVATLEHAFSTRNVTQKFLGTCYAYLPNITAAWDNPGILGGDETWWNIDRFKDQNSCYLAQGYQNISDPYLNYWDGAQGGKNLFIAIRDCNIFLENIYMPTDLEDSERRQWIAEVKTLKAYYHFYLMQLYGPIPIVKENIPVNAMPEEVRVYRDPVDDVAEYIAQLVDEAIPDLLLSTEDTKASDAGRITKPVAAAIKAKALVLAASPLFNGNPDYTTFKDKRGVQLISSEYNASKWIRAADAVREAIEIAHEAGHRFHNYIVPNNATNASPITKLKCTLRAAITEKFNPEIIWPSVAATNSLEMYVVPSFGTYTSNIFPSEMGPTLKVAEQFYTRNGLPIDEDPEWMGWIGENFIQRYETKQASTAAGSGIGGVSSLSEDHKYYIGSNETTAKLHFYREPRFYAWIGFDRGIWEMNGILDDTKSHVIKARAGENQGAMGSDRHVTCGYFTKKLVNMETVKNDANTGMIQTRYTYPIIRLSDLYLLYAEALNETKITPDEQVYQWVDSVRLRAGLTGVVDSWAKATANAQIKSSTKDGMREIIKRERLIELSFESQRFFDLLRWKDALQYLNEPVKGWGYREMSLTGFYTVNTYWDQRVFNTRDYLWPLKLSALQVNSNLVQNPGW